jgi:hypothetical protein
MFLLSCAALMLNYYLVEILEIVNLQSNSVRLCADGSCVDAAGNENNFCLLGCCVF